MPPACHGLSGTCHRLPPSAMICQGLSVLNGRFRGVRRGRSTGPIYGHWAMSLSGLVLGSNTSWEGPRSRADGHSGKEGRTPQRPVTVCHIVQTDVEARLRRHFANRLAGDFGPESIHHAACAGGLSGGLGKPNHGLRLAVTALSKHVFGFGSPRYNDRSDGIAGVSAKPLQPRPRAARPNRRR